MEKSNLTSIMLVRAQSIVQESMDILNTIELNADNALKIGRACGKMSYLIELLEEMKKWIIMADALIQIVMTPLIALTIIAEFLQYLRK